MADIRINALTTTATASASDDYIAIDGSANGTRKLSAYSPTFGGNLTVSGTNIKVNNSTGYFYVDSGSSLTGMILSRTNNILELATANVTRLTISSAGNTTLSGNLTVSGTGDSSIGGTLLVNGASPSGNGAIQLATHTTSAGGIGFGTDTALYRQQTSQLALDCTGGVSMVQFRTSGTYNGRVGYDGSNVELRSVSGSVVLISNNTTALTLDSSQNAAFAGQVNSGTSSSSGYNNNYNVQLEGPVGRIIVNKNSASSSGTLFAGFGRNGSGLGSITQDGTTGVLYNTTSDARLKENVRDVTNSGVIIDALKPCVFDWKNDGDKNRFGFLAQEVHAVFPQAVKKGDDGEEVTDAWAMDAAKLVPVLVAELKALRARVSALEN